MCMNTSEKGSMCLHNYPLVGMNRHSDNCANSCMLGGWTDVRVIFGFKDCQA